LSMASLMSDCATMAYLSNTDRVFHPPIFIITPSATPARRRLRAAVRRRSWKSRLGTPAVEKGRLASSRKFRFCFLHGFRCGCLKRRKDEG
jgi:hypothetical protein